MSFVFPPFFTCRVQDKLHLLRGKQELVDLSFSSRSYFENSLNFSTILTIASVSRPQYSSSDFRILSSSSGSSVSASSEPELIGKILSFREEVKAIKPDWLVEEVAETVKKMHAIYT